MATVPPDNQQVFQTTAGLMNCIEIEETIVKGKAKEEEQNNQSAISKDQEGFEYQTKPYNASQPSNTLPVVGTLYSERFNTFTHLTVAHLTSSEHVTLNKNSLVVQLSGDYYQDTTTSLSNN